MAAGAVGSEIVEQIARDPGHHTGPLTRIGLLQDVTTLVDQSDQIPPVEGDL